MPATSLLRASIDGRLYACFTAKLVCFQKAHEMQKASSGQLPNLFG